MSDLGWFPFYWRHFDEATREFTNEEVGAYMRLLYYQWQYGSIPDDRARAGRITGEALDEGLWSRLLQKFEPITGLGQDRLANRKMLAVRAEQQDKYDRRARAGRTAANKRWGNDSQGKNATGMRSVAQSQKQSDAGGNGAGVQRKELRHNPVDTPSQDSKSGSKRKAGGRRSRKAPADYRPSDSVYRWAAEKLPRADKDQIRAWIGRELEKLKNHEFQSPRSDWDGTLRNWLLKSIEMGGAPEGAASDPDKERQDVLYWAQMYKLTRGDGETWESFATRCRAANDRRVKHLAEQTGQNSPEGTKK